MDYGADQHSCSAGWERERATLQREITRQQDTVNAMKIALKQREVSTQVEADSLREQLVATQHLVEITRSHVAELEHRLARLAQTYARAMAEKDQLLAELETYRQYIVFRLLRRSRRLAREIAAVVRRPGVSSASDIRNSCDAIKQEP